MNLDNAPLFHFTDEYGALTRPAEWVEALIDLNYDWTDGNAQLEYGE